MRANIVMLLCNRHKLAEQSIRTLYKNTSHELFNLTLVDDESKPKQEYITKNCTYLRIEQSKHITGQARNLGVYFSEKYWGRGEYLYLSDSDVYFTPGWLDKLIFLIGVSEHVSNIKMIGGWNHPFLQPQIRIGTANYTDGDYTQFTHDAIAGASQLMRWETWDKYGPLDAHAQGVCQGEDWAFCQKIVKDGGRVGSIYPRVLFNCGLTNSFGQKAVGEDLVTKELQEAKRKYPDLYYE